MKLSVVVIALNEEKNIQAACDTVQKAIVDSGWQDYEIILVNDGSSDNTGPLIHEMARIGWPRIAATHLVVNEGPGRAFEAGLGLVTGDRVTCIGGDNSFDGASLVALFDAAKKGQFVVSYMLNRELRPWLRRQLSGAYTLLWKTLFGLRVKYINGNAIYPADIVKKITIRADRHAYSAELTTKVSKLGFEPLEVGIRIRSASGLSSAIKPRVLFDTVRTVLWCIYELILVQNFQAAVVKWQTRWS